MKTTIISIVTAALLGFAALFSGRPFDVAEFIAIAFVTGLVAWTVSQYTSSTEPLQPLGRSVRFEPARVATRNRGRDTQRLAA